MPSRQAIALFGGGFAIFFAFVFCMILVVWGVLAWLGYHIWNAPAVQEGLGYEQPAQVAPVDPAP